MGVARMSSDATLDRPVHRTRRIANSDVPKLDTLAGMWTRVGVLFAMRAAASPVDLERLLIDTARAARFDERLFVCAVSWLAQYHGFINGRRLSAVAVALDRQESATLGALLSFARDAAGHAPELDAALSRCRPLQSTPPHVRRHGYHGCPPRSRTEARASTFCGVGTLARRRDPQTVRDSTRSMAAQPCSRIAGSRAARSIRRG